MTMLFAIFRRWLHLLRHFPDHRAVTGRFYDWRPVLISCDCGKVFWHNLPTLDELRRTSTPVENLEEAVE